MSVDEVTEKLDTPFRGLDFEALVPMTEYLPFDVRYLWWDLGKIRELRAMYEVLLDGKCLSDQVVFMFEKGALIRISLRHLQIASRPGCPDSREFFDQLARKYGVPELLNPEFEFDTEQVHLIGLVIGNRVSLDIIQKRASR
jgi:hypothetical protein